MEILQALWPTAFKVKKKDATSLIVQIICMIILFAIASVAIWILVKIPIVGWIVGVVGGLLDLYALIGIVLCVLNYLDVLK